MPSGQTLSFMQLIFFVLSLHAFAEPLLFPMELTKQNKKLSVWKDSLSPNHPLGNTERKREREKDWGYHHLLPILNRPRLSQPEKVITHVFHRPRLSPERTREKGEVSIYWDSAALNHKRIQSRDGKGETRPGPGLGEEPVTRCTSEVDFPWYLKSNMKIGHLS